MEETGGVGGDCGRLGVYFLFLCLLASLLIVLILGGSDRAEECCPDGVRAAGRRGYDVTRYGYASVLQEGVADVF